MFDFAFLNMLLRPVTHLHVFDNFISICFLSHFSYVQKKMCVFNITGIQLVHTKYWTIFCCTQRTIKFDYPPQIQIKTRHLPK